MTTDTGDAMSQDGATYLASCVMAYWLDRGYFDVDVRVERDTSVKREAEVNYPAVWVVRSNLVGGLPK